MNDKLAGLYGNAFSGDFGPTDGATKVRDQLFAAIDEQLSALEKVLAEELPALNAQIQAAEVPMIHLDDSKQEPTQASEEESGD